MKKIIIVFLSILFLFSCVHLIKQPSVCDQPGAEKSYLCAQCESIGARIEDVDLFLQIATAEIDVDKEEVLKFLDDVESFLLVTSSYVELFIFVNRYIDISDTSTLIISQYLKHLNSPAMISEFDRGLLMIHIENQRQLLRTL